MLQLSMSLREACSCETRLYLQPLLSRRCTGSRYRDRKLKRGPRWMAEAGPDKSPSKFTQLLTSPHSNSPGSNWRPLIRFPRCNWQLLIRCSEPLLQHGAMTAGVGGRTGLNPGPEPCVPRLLFQSGISILAEANFDTRKIWFEGPEKFIFAMNVPHGRIFIPTLVYSTFMNVLPKIV